MKDYHYTMIAKNAIQDRLSHLDTDAHIGIGCSGGADSMALLLGLSKVYTQDRAKQVHVVIIDHQLQAETAIVAENTAEAAERFGFHAYIVTINVPETSQGAEADARAARYTAFENMITQHKLQAFLTAHTKNDQAEQVFLGLLRGSGVRSLAGIPEQRGVYIRPFLHALSREGTETVCLENKLSYWNDPHNTSPKYQRVNIRKMIQDTEDYARQSIVDPLSRTAQMSAEDADALDMYTAFAYHNLEQAGWSIHVLKNIPAAVRKRAYRKKLIETGVNTDSVSFELTNRVDAFVTDWRGQGKISFSNNVVTFREYNALQFVKVS